MSSKKRGGQKLGSSRRNRNRNPVAKESDDSFPQTGNEEHGSEQKDFHVVSEKQPADASVLPQLGEAATTCISQQISASELHPQSQDLLAQPETMSKRRKMGSTRKSNRGFKGGGIPEEEPEGTVEVSEGIREEYGVTEEVSVTGDDHQQSLSGYSSSQSIEPESSILQRQHWALGSTIHKEVLVNDGRLHLEIAFQSKPISLYFEPDQLQEAAFSEESISHSFNFSVATTTESKRPPHEFDDSLQMYQQMETLPNTTGQEKTGLTDRHLEEGRITTPAYDFEDVQVSQNTQIYSLVSSVNTIHDQFILNFMGEDKQRESTVSSQCIAEAEEERTQLSSASLINELEQGCSNSSEGLNSSTDGTEGAQTGTANEGISDHCLELKNETLKLTEDLACVQEFKMSEYRESEEEHREVHMVGDRKECDDVVEARFTMQTVEPDKSMTLSPKKKEGASSDQYLSYDTELHCDSPNNEITHHRDEQYDLSDARLLTGESSMGGNIGQTEHSVREQNNEEEGKKDREMRTEEEEAENGEAKLIDLIRKRKVIPFETLHEEEFDTMDISNQAYSLQHDDAGKFLSDMQSKEGACNDLQAGSDPLSEIEICHDTEHYEQEPFQSNDSMIDKEKGNDITENKNQFFEEIKPPKNICDTSALSIGEDRDNNSYTVVSDEAVELTKRKDLSAEDRMLLVYDSLDAEDKVSTEKELTTDHLMKRAEDDELSFPQQLQRKGACIKEDFDRDLEKDDKTLQGLSALAKEGDVIKNVEQTAQANVSDTYSGAHEDDTMSHLSEEESKAVDCVEVIAATVTNSALDLRDDLRTEVECVVTGDSIFSQAGENPVHPVSNKCSHITELASFYNTFDEKKENGMEGVIKEDIETETTNILQNDETLTTSFVYEGNKEIKEGNGAKPEYGLLDQENEGPEMNKTQYRGMNIAPTIIVDVAEYKIDSAVLEVQNNSGEVIDAMVQKNKSQENMETEQHGQGQIKKKRKFGSTRRPQSGHRPDTDIEEKLWKDVEATEEIKHDDQNRYSEETTRQAVSQTSVSEVSLGNTDLHSETETVEMIDTTPVILSNAIVCQVDTVVLEENSKAEDPQEITEYEKSTAEDKRTDDSTHSDEQKMSSIITKIPNDTSTYYNRPQEAFMADQDPDMERTDNGSSSQVDASPTSGTMEFISPTQGSLDMLANTESTYDFASDIIRQMSWNLGISVDHLNQPTSRESELESTCSFILIQESKTTEDDVTTNHAELSTLGTKTGLIQRTEQHHEGDQKENIEETSENEGKRGKKDDEGRHGEKKDVPLADSSKISSRKSEVIEEENKETTEETHSAPTEKSATEEFTAVCSEQYMNPGLSSETTKWVLTTNIQTSQGAELSDSKDNDRNIEENAEITGPQAQNQSKKKRKTGSTRRLQGGQRPDTEGKERKWKDVEAAEEFEHDKEERCSKETTCQAATVNSLTESQIAVSEVSLGILDLTLEKEITKSKDETESTDIVHHYINNELSKVEEQVEIIEEHPQSVEDDEKASKPTSSDKQEMPPVIMKTQKDTSIYHDFSQEASMVVKECNVESSENRSPSHAHASLISGIMELISEIQDGLDIPKNIENTETASDQMRQLPWDHNISENHLDLPTNRDSELEQNESTCSLVHKQESKNAQDDVITENSELNTSGKGGKMEPTQKSHRKQFHGYELDNSVQEINEKDRESGEKDYEDMYGEEKDVHLMDRFNRPSSKNETESEETKEVINAGPAKDSNTEDFIAVCSEQYKYSGTSSQVTELGLTTTIQPSPVVIYPDFKEDGEISEDDIEIRDAELHTQNQSKKKRKFGSTRRPQGGHNPNNDREERKWKDVEVTGEFEHNEEERRSKNTIHEAATLNSLTEPQIAVSEVSLGVLDPPVKKEMTESKDETALADVVHHIDNEVSRGEELVEIRHTVVEYERDDESTSTDKQKMAAVITEIEIDTSTYQTSSQEASMVVEKVGIENTENGNPSQVLSSPTCGTMEFISKIQQSLDISLNAENTHEVASYGIKHLAWDQSIPEDHLEQHKRKSEAEQFGNSSTLNHTQQSKTIQGDEITENSDPSTSGKPRKMGSNKRSHKGRVHERDQKNPTEEISKKEEKRGYEDNEAKYGEEKDVHLTEISSLSSRKHEDIEEESKKTMKEINYSPEKNSSTEDFIAVCSEQNMHSGLSSQTTEVGVTTNIQPSPSHSYPKEDDGNGEENVEVKNAELQVQSQSKKKKKFRSTQRPQGGHKRDNDGEERKWKNVEATEQTEYDEEDRCSKETTNQALPSDESISKAHLDQPTNEDPELEKVKSTCSLVHIGEPKTTQEIVMIENLELSTSGKRRKMGSTRGSHREPLRGCGLKESSEEINEKERERDEKDDEDMNGEEKDVFYTETSKISIRKNEVVEEESEDIKEELEANPTEDSTTEDFIEVGSEQDMHCGLSPQSTQLGLTTNIQPSPMTEHSNSKDDGGNSEENVEIKNTKLHTQSQSKKRRKFGSTRRPQGGHKRDNDGEERKWKNVEATEQTEYDEEDRCSKETTNQAAPSDLLAEPQCVVSEESLGILHPTLNKDTTKSNDETTGCGMIDISHVISTDIVDQHTNNEVHKTEKLVEIIEEHGQSVEEDERGDESTSSDNQTVPPVVTEIQNDVSSYLDSTQEVSIIVEGHDMKSTENRSQVHDYATCGTVELISEVQDETNAHEFVSEQIGQLPCDKSISKDHLDQPTNEDPELEKVESTCSLVHIEEPKTTQENVMTENLELSTSGKRRKMGSTRRSHREPLHGGGLKESSEEINEKERESNEKDNEDDVHLTERSDISSRKKDLVEEESEETKDQLKASPTEDSTTEDFIAVCSEQYMDSGLSSQTTELGLATNIKPSPVTEHSDSKEDDGGNSKENVEIKNTVLHTQNQSKKKRKRGSTQRHQAGHRPDNEVEERRWKDVESTEEIEDVEEERRSKEATNQTATSELLTEPQSAVSEVSLGILGPPLEKEIIQSNDETEGRGIIDRPHVILTDTLLHHSNNEVRKVEELVEIIEEHEQSVVEDERGDESTSSETIPPVVTEIQNVSTFHDFSQEASIIVEGHDMESNENKSPSQAHLTPTCGTVELISEAQDSLGNPVNTENTHELVSEQIGQLPFVDSISNNQQDQPTNEDPELEKVESTCSLVHVEEPKITQENVMIENLELSTSEKQRKMGSTRRSHREPLHGGSLKESTEEINEKERESNEKDNEDNVHLTERLNVSSRKKDIVEEESEEIKDELKASPTEDSTTEDFIAVCSEQYMDSGLSSQTTELGVSTNIQPSPSHSYPMEDDGNGEENIEVKNAELQVQSQSKKKKKTRSTQRPQGGHRRDNDGKERKWKNVEATEQTEYDEEDRCSKETTNQAASSDLFAEPQCVVSEESLGILHPTLNKDTTKSNDETTGCGMIDISHVISTDIVVQHTDNEVHKTEKLVEIIEEHGQSVEEDERGDESTSSDNQTVPPVVTEIQNDVSSYLDSTQEVSIIVEGHDMKSTENRSQVHDYATCGTVELISEVQDIKTNAHEFVSEQIGQLPCDKSISKDQLDQPTNEDPELEKVKSTCSLIHIEEPKTTQENVMTENVELSTSGKRRKMGSTRRSHREPLHGGGLKESTEEINEKERESNEKDNEDMYGEEKDVHLTETSDKSIRKNDVVEESEEIKEELKASPTEDSTTEDFIEVCSEQDMHFGLSSQTIELGLATNIQPSPVTEHSDSKDDGGNSEENVEIKSTELHTQNQSKEKRKFGSTQRHQGGHRPDNEVEERRWKDVESTEEIEDVEEERCSKEATNQAATSELLTEPQSAVSEVSLGILGPPLKKEMIESNDETGGCGIIDRPHVILTDTLLHHSNNEVNKAEELMEIIEECEQSVVEDERGDESTSSETIPPVVTEIQNDVSTFHDFSQEASIIVEGHDMESNENKSPSQAHLTPTCGTVELISEAQDSLGNPVNTENTHELVSEQIGQLPFVDSISNNQQDQPTNEDPELEKVESTCSLVHVEEPKITQENVMIENLELSTSEKRRKMGSTRRSHREPLHGGSLKESTEEINEKERESNEKDNEDDVHLTERSNISSRKKDVVEEESEEIKNELKASPTEDSTTEDFIAVCSEQDIDSGLSSQTTELGLTTNLQPSPVSEHSDYEEEDGNGEENIEVKNAELEAQSQSKKKKKFGSTRRPQGRHRPVNEEERKRKEATEETQHDKEEKCSKEAKSQAASSYFLTEPQNAVNGESLGILDPTLEKEIAESKDETGGCGMIDTSHVILTDIVVQHTDNEVQNALELVEIVEEQRQSVVGYERDEECTFSDKQKIPPVVTEIQNDTSTYNDFSKVAEECDIESKENRSFSQVHVTPICGTVELISEVQDSLGIPVNTENTHEFVSEQIGQLPSDESISKDQLDQPTNEDPELEKVKSTCSLIHIEEPKTTQENVMTENVELSTSGKRRKMGSTRRSHREPLHGGGLKESTEEINEKERESNEKDNEDMYGEEKDVHLTETSDKSIRKNDVVEESEEIKEELKASPTEDSTTEDFIEVCSEQDMHFGLSSQTIELGLATNIQPSPVTEHSDSKDDGGNSEENVEIKSTELHTQNQSKEKRKFGSTQRHQGGHRPDNEVEERRWKDVESTEEIEDVEEERCSKEATNQAATSELLTEPQSAVSEVSLGILGPPLKKEMIESNDETGGCGIIDRPHVILTDTLLHHSNNEVNKAEELMEIIEECEQSVVEDERGDESTSSETIPPVVTEIQNDVSTFHDFSQEASIIVEGHDMESNENKSPSQAHLTPTCGTVELISEAQDSLGNPVNTENTHELVSEQIGQLPFVDSISNNQQDQPTNEDPELEKVESTCSLVHVEEPKITQENVMIENLELSTSEKRRKMGSTRRSHREPLHGGSLKESTEEINEKERESNEKDNEDDVHLTERSNISSRKKDVVEEESEEIKNELKASPTEDSTTEDFIAVCSEQDIDSGLSSQTTELGLTTNLQPSPVSEHSDYEEEDGNGEENIEVKNAELEAQSQSKKKKKFGSTRRPQGRHRPVNEEERKRKEATEETQHDKEEKCSKEAKSQAASSYFLTEPQNAVNGESLGILDPTLEKEIAESKDETGGCGMIDTSHVILTDIVVQHTDNEVQNALELVEIVEEQRQSVVGYERDEECTFSDKQKIPPVVTEIQNDTSTYNDFSKVAEECDIESKENRSFSQVHVTPICGTVELISEVQDSLGIPVNTENTHEFVSEQIGQLPSDESISKDQLDQPTNEDPELEKVKSTCSLIHIEEPKTTQENVMTENVELSTSGKRRKMGSTRRSHREPLHGGGLKESTEEINEKERESNEKDNEDMYGEEKDVHLTETSDKSIRKNDVVEESEEIKEELKASPTEDSTTEDFIEVCSEQDMHFGLSSQTIELGLATNIQPSPVTEHSDSKDDGGNSEENVEIKSTELHTQNQSKEKRKFGSTQRHQGGHRPDNEVEERRWKDVESTEEIEDVEEERCSKEATNQAATSELLTEPQSAVSEVSLGILGPPLKKEMIESNDETGGCGIIDRPHVILTDTLLHHSNNEVNKAEELMEIVEECEQSVVEDERGDESTSSETIPPVVTEIENDVSTYHYFSQEASIIVEGHDMERNENRSPSQVHVTLKCGTVELISEVQDRLGNPVNTENTHELLSEQIRQLPSDESTSKDQIDQPTNKDPELEKVESTCSLVHIEQPNTTQENVMIENLELSTSGKRRKMGSTRRTHRAPLHGGDLKETIEGINGKERESGEKHDEDMYGVEKDVPLTERSSISSRKKDVVEEESEEIKDKLKASPTEDSTTEDFIAVCSEQYMDSGLFSQTTELGLITNIQRFPVSEHSDSEEDDGNGEENIEVKNAELQTQSQSKEKKKFRSTRRPQGRYRRDNEEEERKWKNVEAIERAEHDEEEKCSKEANSQAASSDFLTESQNAVSGESLVILYPTLEKEIAESKDETGGCGMIDTSHVILTDIVVQHTDNEVQNALELVEIFGEHRQSVVGYERDEECTFSDKQKIPPVVTEIQNDTSKYHDFSEGVEECDIESNENRNRSQVHVTPRCGTVELISEAQDSLGFPVNTENTHELLSEQIGQLPSDESISKAHLDQPTNEDPELEKVKSTCSLIHIEEPKTTQENVMIENLELSTSGKRRKMGSTRRSHREPLRGCGLKESSEEINEKERESDEKDDEDMNGEEKDLFHTETSNISIRKNEVVEEESDEIKEELEASPTEHSTTEDFIEVGSEQDMHCGLSPQSTQLGLTTNIQPSPMTEHSNSKDDGGNSEENVEIKNTKLHTQSQSKKRRKFGSTRRPQGGHRPDNKGEERKWKDVESTEKIEDDEEERHSKETTHQAATSELLTEPQSAVSEVSLGIPVPPLEKEMIESNDETEGCGIIDRPHVILTDTLLHYSDNEVRKVEELVEIIEEREQSVVEDETGDESTSSNKQKIPQVIKEIQNDVSTYLDSFQEASIIVKGYDMESHENRSLSQVHVTPTCGIVELISEVQDSLAIPVNPENAHELVSEQIGQLPSDESTSKDQLDQSSNEDPVLEKVKSTCSLIHREETKITQENVMTENVELSTSGKRRKMGSTRRSHKERLHGGDLKETIEAINEKEREKDEKDDEDMYGEEKDLLHTETSNKSIRKNEVVEEESDEIKEELEASPTEHSTNEDFIEVCSEQDMHCGLSPQSTQLGLTTNMQPSPMTEHLNSKDDGGNSKENVEIINIKLHTQNQSEKKRKFGSTRRHQGGHRPDNEVEERRWKDVESTEEIEDVEEERCSTETTHQAATSELLTEPQSAVSEMLLGIPEPPLEKEMIESNDETGGCGIIDRPHVILTDTLLHHSDNEIRKVEELVEIIEEREQSVVEDEAGDESTSSNKQKILQVIKEIQNDVSTYLDSFQEASIIVKGYDMESHENRSLSQVHVTPTCGTVELISKVQDSLAIPLNPENAHELVSEQIGQLPSDESTSKDQLDQPSNEDPVLEKVKSTCSLIHREETKTTQENVMIENLELSTSGKRRKMGSTRRSHRERLHGGDLKETIEEINEKEREKGEKDDEDMYGEEKDVYLKERSYISIRKNEAVEAESEEIKDKLKASPTEDSTTEDFTEVCSEQDMHSGLSPQTTELDLISNIQPSPVTKHSDSREDDGNSKENVKIRNADLQTQSQSKKKRKFGSTRRPQGVQILDTEEEERRWKDVEATEGLEHDEKERCSEETHQAVTSNLLTESLNAGSEVSLGILIEEMKEKESSKEQTVDESAPITEESNSEVERLSFIPTIPTETCHQSIERQSEPSESITIIRPELEKLDKKKRKMGSTRKNFKGGDAKKPWDRGTGDMDPTSDEDITKEETKSTARVDTVLDDKGFGRSVIIEMIGQEHELQTPHMLDQSEGSLLGEIEYELKKSCQSPLNTIAHSISEEISESSLNKPLETHNNQHNILEIPEPKDEQCKSTLKLPASQSSQTHTEPSSPGRRRKMGSTRKTPRNKHTEEPRDESRDTEQDTETQDTLGTNSDLERETTMLTAKVHAVPQVDENNTDHPIPGGRRKFGSRRTAKGELMLNQKETEAGQVLTDELTVDPYFIPGPESIPVSQLTSDHEDTKASPSNEQNEKSVVNEADKSTRTGLASFGDLRRSSLYNGSTGRREIIDFERWDEQIPDFGVAVYNVVMVGNCNVGKTSFIRRFQSGLFSKDYGSTIGVDTFVQTITLGNRTVKLHIWDTAGQERYHSITRQVFHKAQGLLLMYDITSSQSFYAVRKWISQIQERAPADVTMMLLGNKNDCAEREVQLKEGEDLSRDYNIHFMECSVATGENVSESMKSLAWLLVKQNVRREEEQAILQPKQPQKKSGCC